MRVRHTPHSLPTFPVYSAAFLSPNDLVLGGGGGSTKSGIKNRMRLYHVGADGSLELKDEIEVPDAPMSMAAETESQTIACGINSPQELLEKGENDNCRVFSVKDQKFAALATAGTLPAGSIEDYQKVTVVSPDGKLVLVAGNNDFTILTYPSLQPVVQSISTGKDDIYDATFSSKTVVVATTANLIVYAIPKLPEAASSHSPSKKRKGKQKAHSIPDLEILRTVEVPASLGGVSGSTFRSARYHPQDETTLYTVTNTVPVRSRKKTPSRQAFVCKWSTESWTVSKVRKVSDKGLTCFDISSNGKLLGYGSSDYSIGLLDSSILTPVVTILKAHDFPPTTLKFNPTSTLVVSGSADNTVRVVSVPEAFGGSSWNALVLVIVTILVMLLAIAAQKYGSTLL
ncbi:WD40 repeat-like protein [Pleurotus eryngii]|uniref:WD40 repeat-like protein n=1 Tax=Pleurotus eryngii TaxID=5323 RepID=A0A9P6DI87_PLEER|nr:WD40 repeat-like protein [Pleurotus eryngii]